MKCVDFLSVYDRNPRISGRSDWIDLGFVERERTSSRLMALRIRFHLGELSLSNTVRELEEFGVERSRKAVHDGVQKADLQPANDASPDHIALDETVSRINGQQYWLYAAIDSNWFLHARLFTTTTTAVTQQFLQELRKKHDISDAVFLVDHAHHFAAALQRADFRFQPERYGNRNAVERVFREVKRRKFLFRNGFSHVDPATAETWLQAFAVW